MKRLVTLVALAIALHANVALAQEATGIPKEIVKELNSLVGAWEAEGNVGDKEQTGKFTCRWRRGLDKKKCCLVGFFAYTTENETRSGVTLIGWNAVTKCIEDRGFDTNGGCDVLSWTVKSPTEWHGKVLMVEDGQEVRSEAVLVKKGPSEIVLESESEKGEVLRLVYKKIAKKRKGQKGNAKQ